VASVNVLGEANDDALTFTSTVNNITGRPTTNAAVPWTLSAWTAGQAYQSPNIAAIIQEIVNRPGWSSGNDLVLILTTSTGERDAVAYDQNSSVAPLLHVEYTTGSSNLNSHVVEDDQTGVGTTAVASAPTFDQSVFNGVRQLWTKLVISYGIARN
jgi:hypothetical protein